MKAFTLLYKTEHGYNSYYHNAMVGKLTMHEGAEEEILEHTFKMFESKG